VSRDRYDDTRSLGRSRLVPYLPDEDAAARHRRRLDAALVHQSTTKIENWCQKNGCKLAIFNYGHHWKIVGEGFLAEWWPSSGKLVFDHQYQRGIHCHDRDQLVQALDRALRRKGEQ
jgi:hypothetical protein